MRKLQATRKRGPATLATIQEQFKAIQATYGLEDPEQIKERISFRYLTLLVMHLVPPQERLDLKYHIQHFHICDKIIKQRPAS